MPKPFPCGHPRTRKNTRTFTRCKVCDNTKAAARMAKLAKQRKEAK